MKLLVALEHRFSLAEDGNVYAEGPCIYDYWRPYVESFGEVNVLARVGRTSGTVKPVLRASGPGVRFLALPDYRGPWQYAMWRPELWRRARAAVGACDAYLLLVPGLVGRLAWFHIRKSKRPYGVHVLGDPWDVFAPGVIDGLGRAVFRRVAAGNLKAMCKEAAAAAYCTSATLQRRYPHRPGVFSLALSRVRLQELAGPEAIEERRERLEAWKRQASPRRLRLGFIGTFATMYKGPDVLLRALQICRTAGLEIEAELVGQGQHREAMERLARDLGLEEHARFHGQIPPGGAIVRFLDGIDLFVMPSRTEGLPRALIEAMARGCPSLASNVGGIPELLPPDDLVPPGDPDALAARIKEIVLNPERMTAMARRNLEEARNYGPEVLAERQRTFCKYLRDVSAR